MSEKNDVPWEAEKQLLDALAAEVPLSGLRFDDPKAAKRKSMSPAFLNARKKGQGNVAGAGRRSTKSVEDRVLTDRIDGATLKSIQDDPSEFLRQQLSKMLAQEQHVNDDLYKATPLDDKAISASNKRIMEIGDSLKALPKQTVGEALGNQRSLAELIEDAQKEYPEGMVIPEEEVQLSAMQLERASAAFGEGS